MLNSKEIRNCFSEYISQAIKSKAIEYKRKLNKRIQRELQFSDEILNDESLMHGPNCAIYEFNNISYRELEKVFTDVTFHDAMKQLPDKYKQVLYFFIFKEMNSEEVGNLLNITPTNARKIKERAINKFLEILKKEGK